MDIVVTETEYAQYGRDLVASDMIASTLAYAQSVVDEVVGNNEPVCDDDSVAYIRAVCAVADIDASYNYSRGSMEGITSAKVGDFSVSYSNDGATTYTRDVAQAIRRELAGTGLMYSGVH
jgi:hypothetical protein